MFLVAIYLMLAINFFSSPASAQVNINMNVNLDEQPAWGSTGYDYAGY